MRKCCTLSYFIFANVFCYKVKFAYPAEIVGQEIILRYVDNIYESSLGRKITGHLSRVYKPHCSPSPGAYDAAIEGSFEWGDCSSSVTFLRNNFNNPVGFPIDEEKDCAFYDQVNDYFDDSECEVMLPFVCEITQLGESSL